jgi:hypothetical protein
MNDDAKLDALHNLRREGCASYLDALYALHRFRRDVTDIAASTLRARLPELVSAVGIQGPRPSDVIRYCDPDGVGSECDGNWGWITACIWFPAPWEGNCHLGLSFERNEISNSVAPYVTFMSGQFRYAGVFTKVNSAYRRSGDRDREHYYDDSGSQRMRIFLETRESHGVAGRIPKNDGLCDQRVEPDWRLGQARQLKCRGFCADF